ncbi:MAG: carboxypeptidase-like regulatory domain-containing protein [Candidatus Acidiferrales bacterium]
MKQGRSETGNISVRTLQVWLLVVAIAGVSSALWAQAATTSLRGTVADSSGAMIAGATLTLSNPHTGFSRLEKTDSDGGYSFLQIPPATYTLSVTAAGFGTAREENVALLVNSPVRLNFTLQVQSQTSTVAVTSAAPMVNTQDASLGHAIGVTQIESLPFEGRDPSGILTLQAGVTFLGNSTSIDQDADSRSGAVNGARSDQTNITIDGVDDNDQVKGYAFQGALRATLDSLQEFRVTTSNANADAGRSSGAQVVMVTKSGTNQFHGSLYEYNRPPFTAANDWFNKQSELNAGLPNVPGELLRNTFGAAIGGPIKKDRLFFFATYEGQRLQENTQVTRSVPSADMRQGIVHYLTCGPDISCGNGTITPTEVTLQPSDIAKMDPNCTSTGTCPWGPGVNPNILPVLQGFPLPNTTSGDGFNIFNYTFSAPAPAKLDTYIVKLDYNITSNGNHRLFVRGNLQNDHISGTAGNGPQFPGDPSNVVNLNNSKGLAAGYTAVLSPNVINNLRYAFIRQGVTTAGLSDQPYVAILTDPQGFTRTSALIVPVHNIVDDVTWTKGRHTIQFGGNLRIVNNDNTTNANSFIDAEINLSYLPDSGLANKNQSFDPAKFGYPAVAQSFAASYDGAMGNVVGLIPEVIANYNRDKTGAVLAPGAPVVRHFRTTESEFYLQDSWQATPNLTLIGGLRYTLLQPPYETNGNQVAPTVSFSDFFDQRYQAMIAGQTYNPVVSYDLAGPANGRPPLWNWDYKDVAPRIAFAWSPSWSDGWRGKLAGGPGKTSIRGGYGIYYDHFGEGVISTFDQQGSFGLNTVEKTAIGQVDVDTAPRFTGINDIPASLVPPPPTGGFPYTPPTDPLNGGSQISWGADNRLKTPYSNGIDFSITRQLPAHLVLETSYVGRFAHHLLQQEDLAMPLDIVDPKSKTDYFAAATALSKLAGAQTDVHNVQPIPYWQNMFPTAAGADLQSMGLTCAPGTSGAGAIANPTATQAMYALYACNLHDETSALYSADLFCTPACSTINGVTQPNNYFDSQWSSLLAWRTIGSSSYNSGQVTLRGRLPGLLFDFNYTLSKSIDLGSDAERVSRYAVGDGFDNEIVNSWAPKQMRAVSDFDTTHQINANWVYDIPLGRGKRFGSEMNKVADQFLGNWQFTGLAHWTSGFPFSVENSNWPTNWELLGKAVLDGPTPQTGTFIDAAGNPNLFKDPTSAVNQFRYAYPGESGDRNDLRGPGFFGVDVSAGKIWKITESQRLEFRAEAFNLTNSVRFGILPSVEQGIGNLMLGSTANFGEFNETLTKPRDMEFSLRYSF